MNILRRAIDRGTDERMIKKIDEVFDAFEAYLSGSGTGAVLSPKVTGTSLSGSMATIDVQMPLPADFITIDFVISPSGSLIP